MTKRFCGIRDEETEGVGEGTKKRVKECKEEDGLRREKKPGLGDREEQRMLEDALRLSEYQKGIRVLDKLVEEVNVLLEEDP
tara:strand:+ start:1514 stop:1759 length:246 start_codon:yes stop_codon:yes gene_type:complete